MPRTKESDDEYEIKTGRRSKAISGTNVVDSPLRRSTRNRQQINRELSPDGVNVTPGPVTRITRRKAASQEVFTSETTRTLRSRKTSFTSDTSENHDLETGDIKRTTRKSTTAAGPSDTSINIRLRRSIRAGSESKTIQSPAKVSRLTRASSLDLEERDNEIQSNLQEANNSTPIKLRRRASIFPSEPALVEEIEKDHNSFQKSLRSIIEDDQKKKQINDTEDDNKHSDLSKSPVPQLCRGFTPEIETSSDQSNENVNDTSISPSKSSGGCSLKSILEEMNDSQLKEESEILNKSKNQIYEIIQTPKVVVEKMKFPFNDHTSESLEISPNNKENEKSNVTIPAKRLKFLSSEEASTQRKSLIATASEKISVVKRLNKTIDDKMLITIENSSNESLLISKKPLETFSDIKAIDGNICSVNIGLNDESNIVTEKIKKSDDNLQSSENVNTQQEQDLKDTSLNLSINEDLKLSENNDVIKEPFSQNNEISMMIIDEDETNSLNEKPQIINKSSDVTSPLIGSEKADKEHEQSPLNTEEVNSNTDEPQNDKSEKEIIIENNFKDELSINETTSTQKKVEENNEESNKNIDDESDYDLNQLFKDIPADEWNEDSVQSSENDNLVEKNLNIKTKKQENTISDKREERNFEKESAEDFELVLVDKKAWEAAEADRLKKLKQVHNFASLDTIETDGTSRKSIDPPASPSFEEAMDIEENETETEVKEVSEEVKNTSDNSSLEQVNDDKQILNENSGNIEECEKKDTPTLNKCNTPEKKVKHKQITPIKIGPVTSPKKLFTKDNDPHTRKSLESLLSKYKPLKTSPLPTRKSLNPSIKLDDITADTNARDEKQSSINALENAANKSLETSELDNTLEIDTKENEENKCAPTTKFPKDINKSLNQSINKKTEDKLCNASDKETIATNLTSQINSDADMHSTDSENESDDLTVTLPAFLYGESSSSSDQQENDSSNIDSDVAREYNLDGNSVLEYSDDNIPGDICHASETESSDSDEEDDDMADFIVDDDEESELESIESNSDKEEIISDDKNEIKDDTDESNKETEDDDETNDEYEEIENEEIDKNIDITKNNEEKEEYQLFNKLGTNKLTMNLTPDKSTILHGNKIPENENQISKVIESKVDKLNTSLQSVKSTKKDKSRLLKKSNINLDDSFDVDNSPTASKLSKTSSFNKSMLTPCTTSPETLLLLKEKLNDTLPALKLEQSGKRRKSSLYFVEENDNEEDVDNDKSDEMSISNETVDKTSEEKTRKNKKKKTKKWEQNGFNVEDISTQIHETSQLSKIVNKNLEKKKKKVLKENNTLTSSVSLKKKNEKMEKKQKSSKTKKNKEKSVSIKEIDHTSTKKMKKKKDDNKNNVALKRVRRLSSETYYTAEEAETNSIKNVKVCQKMNKSKSSLLKLTNSEAEKSSSIQPVLTIRHKLKRLPDDVIEGLLDVPIQPKKKRKLLDDQKVLPSRKMFDLEHPKPDNICIEDNEYIPLSSSGGTTSFYVMNLEKPKKSKKLAAVYSFRERMLRRNQRQPISAYLMYQQKLKASNNVKY